MLRARFSFFSARDLFFQCKTFLKFTYKTFRRYKTFRQKGTTEGHGFTTADTAMATTQQDASDQDDTGDIESDDKSQDPSEVTLTSIWDRYNVPESDPEASASVDFLVEKYKITALDHPARPTAARKLRSAQTVSSKSSARSQRPVKKASTTSKEGVNCLLQAASVIMGDRQPAEWEEQEWRQNEQKIKRTWSSLCGLMAKQSLMASELQSQAKKSKMETLSLEDKAAKATKKAQQATDSAKNAEERAKRAQCAKKKAQIAEEKAKNEAKLARKEAKQDRNETHTMEQLVKDLAKKKQEFIDMQSKYNDAVSRLKIQEEQLKQQKLELEAQQHAYQRMQIEYNDATHKRQNCFLDISKLERENARLIQENAQLQSQTQFNNNMEYQTARLEPLHASPSNQAVPTLPAYCSVLASVPEYCSRLASVESPAKTNEDKNKCTQKQTGQTNIFSNGVMDKVLDDFEKHYDRLPYQQKKVFVDQFWCQNEPVLSKGLPDKYNITKEWFMRQYYVRRGARYQKSQSNFERNEKHT